MRKHSTLILGLILILGLAIPGAAQFSRSNNADRVCVYRDNNYNGREQCYYPGDEISDIRGAEISSIRIDGRAAVVVYEDRDFRGSTMEFRSNTPDLAQVSMSGSRAWNDRVGSLRIISSSNSGRYDSRNDDYGRYGYPSTNEQASLDTVCIYEDPNYRGRSQCWSAGAAIPDLSGWSDRISSIRVGAARVMVFRDIRYQGDRLIIDRDIPNLSQLGLRNAASWNDQISSMQIQADRNNGQGRGWARGRRRY